MLHSCHLNHPWSNSSMRVLQQVISPLDVKSPLYPEWRSNKQLTTYERSGALQIGQSVQRKLSYVIYMADMTQSVHSSSIRLPNFCDSESAGQADNLTPSLSWQVLPLRLFTNWSLNHLMCYQRPSDDSGVECQIPQIFEVVRFIPSTRLDYLGI